MNLSSLSIRGAAASLCLAVVGAVIPTGPAVAQADPATTPQERRVDQREARQAQRIQSGAASGQLTAREQRRLQNQQAKTERIEQRVESDGVVTRREAARLEQRQDRTSRAISRQKHDRQQR